MPTFLAILALHLMAATACTDPRACDTDSECFDGEVCVNNACVASGGDGGAPSGDDSHSVQVNTDNDDSGDPGGSDGHDDDGDHTDEDGGSGNDAPSGALETCNESAIGNCSEKAPCATSDKYVEYFSCISTLYELERTSDKYCHCGDDIEPHDRIDFAVKSNSCDSDEFPETIDIEFEFLQCSKQEFERAQIRVQDPYGDYFDSPSPCPEESGLTVPVHCDRSPEDRTVTLHWKPLKSVSEGTRMIPVLRVDISGRDGLAFGTRWTSTIPESE